MPELKNQIYFTFSFYFLLIIAIFSILGISLLPKIYSQESNSLCGPMDIAIALDSSSTMKDPINNIIKNLNDVFKIAKMSSNGDIRIGYATFRDYVTVVQPFTNNLSSVQKSIQKTSAKAGGDFPQASDEVKNTLINNLNETNRKIQEDQIGNFSAPWREYPITKLYILITNAPPGGFNDKKEINDIEHLYNLSLIAKEKDIRIANIFVPTNGDYDQQFSIYRNDSNINEGIFITTNPSGANTADVLKQIIKSCGILKNIEFQPKIEPVNNTVICPTENIQHWNKILFTIDDPLIANKLHIPTNSELSLIFEDVPLKITELKKKIVQFLKSNTTIPLPTKLLADSINIIFTDYETICGYKKNISQNSPIDDHKKLFLINVTGFDYINPNPVPLDIVFAIDSSETMSFNDPNKQRVILTKAFLSKLNSTRDKAGLVIFDKRIESAIAPSSNITYIMSQLNKIDNKGGTNPYLGLQKSIELLDKSASKKSLKFIFYIADAYPYNTTIIDYSLLDKAAKQGYKIFTIGIGNKINGYFLNEVANYTGGKYIKFDTVENSINNIGTLNMSSYNIGLTNVNITGEAYNHIAIDKDSFNISPNKITKLKSGTFGTLIEWFDVANKFGNKDNIITNDESIQITFSANLMNVNENNSLPYFKRDNTFLSFVDKDGNIIKSPISIFTYSNNTKIN